MKNSNKEVSELLNCKPISPEFIKQVIRFKEALGFDKEDDEESSRLPQFSIISIKFDLVERLKTSNTALLGSCSA